MSNLEKYLESLRKLSSKETYLTESYLILDAELRRLEAVVTIMENKEQFPDSNDFQKEILQSVTINLNLLRDFLKATGHE